MVVLKDINSFGLLNHDKNPLPGSISFHLSIGKLIFAIEAVGKAANFLQLFHLKKMKKLVDDLLNIYN